MVRVEGRTNREILFLHRRLIEKIERIFLEKESFMKRVLDSFKKYS